MIVYQLGLKSKFRLMCEGGFINGYLRARGSLCSIITPHHIKACSKYNPY